jgi:hypothetical protein
VVAVALAVAVVVAGAGAGWAQAPVPAGVGLPRPDHVLILMLENKSYAKVIGSPRAPYLNQLAAAGANFTSAWAETHPSQPNYLALFSGGTRGVTTDHCVDLGDTPNLGRQLFRAGLTFAGYAEDQPELAFRPCHFGTTYVRRHAPWHSFGNLPRWSLRTGAMFPWGHLDRLPTVAWFTPNLCHSTHDCNLPTGDAWLAATLPAYVTWAATHNSLLIITFDEAGRSVANQIPTIFVGPMVAPGDSAQVINHYSILRTIEDMYGLAPLAKAAAAAPIAGIWR